jgi:deoxyxylulose-5-phosphate synthase
MKFATEVAMGAGITAAYRAAYGPSNPGAPSVYSNAKRAAKLPQIVTAVSELRLRYMPAEADMQALYHHGLATMVDLTNSDDPRVRFVAAKWLCEEAAAQRKVAATTDAAELESQLATLRQLYQHLESAHSAEQVVMEIERAEEDASEEM